MNSVFKGTHNLPITTLVKSTYYGLWALFALRRIHKVEARVGYGKPLFESYVKLIKKEVIKSKSHKVMQFFRERYIFFVCEIVDHK